MQTRNWKQRKHFLAKLALKNDKEKNEKNSQQLLKVNDNFFMDFDFFFNTVKELTIPPIEYLQEQLHITTLLSNDEIYSKQKELSVQWIPKMKKNWTDEDKQILIWIVLKIASRDNFSIKHLPNSVWEEVVRLISRRTVEQCKNKWNSLLKLSLQQTPWTKEQDSFLMDLIKKCKEEGLQNQWCLLANQLNQQFKEAPRTGKQCRERWNNHLNPEISRDPWSLEEDLELITIAKKFKKKWAFISNNLNTKRSENAVKNRYNCLMKKYHCPTLISLLEVLKNKFKQENPHLPFPKLKKRKLNPTILTLNKAQEVTNASSDSSKTLKIFEIQSFDCLDQNSIKSLKPAFINFNSNLLIMSEKQHMINYFGKQMVKIENIGKTIEEQNLQQIELSNQISGMLNMADSQNYVRYVPCLFPSPQTQGMVVAEKKSQFNIPGAEVPSIQQQKLPVAFIKPDSSFTFFSTQPPTNLLQKY